MVIISHKVIREFAEKHPELSSALERWYDITAKSDWKGFNDIKEQFNSVDAVGDGLFDFNIKGNDCRLKLNTLLKKKILWKIEHPLMLLFHI